MQGTLTLRVQLYRPGLCCPIQPIQPLQFISLSKSVLSLDQVKN